MEFSGKPGSSDENPSLAGRCHIRNQIFKLAVGYTRGFWKTLKFSNCMRILLREDLSRIFYLGEEWDRHTGWEYCSCHSMGIQIHGQYLHKKHSLLFFLWFWEKITIMITSVVLSKPLSRYWSRGRSRGRHFSFLCEYLLCFTQFAPGKALRDPVYFNFPIQ